MATFSNAPSVSAAISAGSTTQSSGTIYTVPANSYALISIALGIGGSTSATVFIGTAQVAFTSSATITTVTGIVAGPGQVISVNNVGGTTVSSVQIVGVLLTNQA